MSDNIIADGKVVIMNYTLRDDEGEILDASDGDPMPYLHGYLNIVPGLEAALTGKKVGEVVKVVVPPEEGYGEVSDVDPQAVPLSEFPDDYEINAGDPVLAETAEGEMIHLWVVGVDDEFVHVTMDHPLAGENLHFEVEIVGLRDATEDELQHGHPHGVNGDEGHHHE